jgi:hypothetical protein
MHNQLILRAQARQNFSIGNILRTVFAFAALAIPTVFCATTNAATLPTSGFYQIINQNSNKCVDVAGRSTADGAAIQIWGCGLNQLNQQWQFVATDSGFYRLVARDSGKVLDVSGISTANGSLIHQWTWWGGLNQQWQAVSVGGGYYKFIARHSGRVIDVPNCNTANGTQLQQWDDLNNACQAFRLVAVETTPPTVPTGLNSPSQTNSSISLAWNASTDNVGVTKYKVYRGGVLVGSPTTTSYTSAGLTASTAYSFTVRACDAANNCSAQTAPITVATIATNFAWERLGPRNIFNEINGNGAAGTCGAAATDPSNPNVVFMGGHNNSAATGFLRSQDRGLHWLASNNGLTDTRVMSIVVDPLTPGLIYVGTPSGIFKSVNSGVDWRAEIGSDVVGGAQSDAFFLTVGSNRWLVAATDRGLAYRAQSSGQWQLSSPPAGAPNQAVYSAAWAQGSNTMYVVLGGGPVYKVILSDTGVTWTRTNMRFNTVTVDPKNANHIVGSMLPGISANDYKLMESWDGGATMTKLGDMEAWYVRFDPRNANSAELWSGGQGGVAHSTNGGLSWTHLPWPMTSRDQYVVDGSDTDVQHLFMDMAGGQLFCHDQGLTRYDEATNSLVSVNGNVSNTIVVSVAPSTNAGALHLLTTMWDWGPTESWDGGNSWQATTWYVSPYWNSVGGAGAPIMGEGGQVISFNHALDGRAHVMMFDGETQMLYSDDGGKNFFQATLPTLSSSQTFHEQQNTLASVINSNRQSTGIAYVAGVVTDSTGNPISSMVYQSNDYGHTWHSWGRTFSMAEVPTHVLVSAVSNDKVFVATSSCIFVGTNGGNNWSGCNKPNSQGSFRSLDVRSTDGAIFAAMDTGEIFMSSDGGLQWNGIAMPPSISTIQGSSATKFVSFSSSGKSIVAIFGNTVPGNTGRAVLLSHDGGQSWIDITGDIHTIQFNNLSWSDGDLYLASSGEGILRLRNIDLLN